MVALAQAFVVVLPDMKRFGPELKVGLRRLDVTTSGKDAGNRFGSGFHSSSSKVLKRGLAGTGLAVGAALGAALTKGFGRLSAIENAEAKLTGLGHSAKTVDKIMVNALASVKGTAFGLDEAATQAAGAVASGIKPGRDLQRTLKLVADAATIGGSSLGEMGAIFNQVAASNKVQGDTINQLNERGIPILKLLGSVMGKSQGQVSELASKGKVDFATFQKAMEQGLGGAALKSGQTATGAFKNMGAAFSRVGAALMKGVFPQLAGGFGTVTKLLDDITPAAARFGVAFGAGLSKVAGFIRSQAIPAVQALFAALVKGQETDTGNWFMGVVVGAEKAHFALRSVKAGFEALFVALAKGQETDTGNWFMGVVVAAVRLRQVMVTQVLPALQQVGGFIRTNILPGLTLLGQYVATTLLPAWLAWYRFLISQMWPILKQVGAFILANVVPALRVVARFIASDVVPGFLSIRDAVMGLIRVVAPIVAQLVGVILSKFREMSPEIKTIWTSVKEIITGVMFIVKEFISSVTTIIKLIWDRWGTQIKTITGSVFGAILKVIGGIMKTIAGVIKLIVALIKGDWKGAWTAIKQIFAGIWQVIKAILVNYLMQIHATIGGTLTKILTRWFGFWTRMRQSAADGINKVRLGISDILGKIRDRFASGVAAIGQAWDGLKAKAASPIRFVVNTVINRGLIGAFNKIAGIIPGVGKLPNVSAGFRTGGYTGNGNPRDVAGQVHKKEYVFDAATVRKAGGPSVFDSFRKAVGRGGDVGLPGYDAGGFVRALSFAQAQRGKPYGFAGVGPSAYDCSGFMSAIQNVIEGKNPHSRRYSTESFAGGPMSKFGFVRGLPSAFRIGVWPNGSGIGHMAGTLMGQNVESAGGVGVRVGPSARGYNNGLFDFNYGLASGSGLAGAIGKIGAFLKSGFTSIADWFKDLIAKPLARLKEVTGSPLGRLAAGTPRMLANGMLDKVKVFDSGAGYLDKGYNLAYNGTGRREFIGTPDVVELGPRSIAAIASALTVEIDGRQVARAVRYQTVRGST